MSRDKKSLLITNSCSSKEEKRCLSERMVDLETQQLVFIVDDMPENLEVLSTFLERESLDIAIAMSGRDALAIATQEVPDLILLDIMMPVMNGFEVCEHLKRNPATHDTPVIFLTARNESADIMRGFACGAVDYVTKPFNMEELVARVFTQLELKKSRDTIEEQNRRLAEQNRELQRLSDLREQNFAAALNESEQRFRSTFEQAAVGSVHVALGGRFLLANQRFCDIVGYTQEQLLQLNAQELMYPEDFERGMMYVEQMLAGERQIYSMEKRYIRRDSTLLWVNVTVSLVQERPGCEKYFLAVFEDISQRKQAEEALMESERLHRLTLSSISDAVFITDNAGDFSFICPNVDVIFGYSPEEVRALENIERLLGWNFFHFDELAARQEIANIERKVTDKFGHVHTLLVTVKHVSIGAGTLLYSCRDISRRKQTEEALRNSEQQYRLPAEAVADGIGIIRKEKWLFVNQTLAGMLGETSEALLGKTAEEFLLDDYRELLDNMYQKPEQTASGAQSWSVLKYVGGMSAESGWKGGKVLSSGRESLRF